MPKISVVAFNPHMATNQADWKVAVSIGRKLWTFDPQAAAKVANAIILHANGIQAVELGPGQMYEHISITQALTDYLAQDAAFVTDKERESYLAELVKAMNRMATTANKLNAEAQHE